MHIENLHGFYVVQLPDADNLFEDLSSHVRFENIAPGRIGNHLVHPSEEGIPVVRTTTKYNIPAGIFNHHHSGLIDAINQQLSRSSEHVLPMLTFNNALIEIYDRNYFKMGYHSDQALDLATNSYIGLVTCYERGEDIGIRTLKIKNKASREEHRIRLKNNTLILFSLDTNKRFAHKIILEEKDRPSTGLDDNRWLGLTLRLSKTFVRFKDDMPYIRRNIPLVLAGDEQQHEFFKLKGRENRDLDFKYPEVHYTLNPGDLLIPV